MIERLGIMRSWLYHRWLRVAGVPMMCCGGCGKERRVVTNCVEWECADCYGILRDGLRIRRTPWRIRRMCWVGEPFCSRPFPYLLMRYDVTEDDDDHHAGRSWLAGFWWRIEALEYLEGLRG